MSTTLRADAIESAEPKAPTKLRARRLLARIHLWIALALGLYIVVLSVSGSAIVFRRELNQWLVPRAVASTEGTRLTGDELALAVRAAYPRDAILEVREPQRPERPVFVALERDGERMERLFDPYAVADLGESFPPVLRAVEWLVDLHDNLLAGQTGRTLNGVGGILFAVLIATGAWLWWPGMRNVPRSLKIGRPRAARRFVWQLHTVFGVVSFGLLFIWAITAIYFAFPEPFERTIDFFDADPNDLHRPGEWILLELIQLHFGRFGGLGIRVLWVVLGLLPAALFVTGFVLWWTSVVRRRLAADTGV
jgi:uncharacterized iron-regulated membrane protein